MVKTKVDAMVSGLLKVRNMGKELEVLIGGLEGEDEGGRGAAKVEGGGFGGVKVDRGAKLARGIVEIVEDLVWEGDEEDMWTYDALIKLRRHLGEAVEGRRKEVEECTGEEGDGAEEEELAIGKLALETLVLDERKVKEKLGRVKGEIGRRLIGGEEVEVEVERMEKESKGNVEGKSLTPNKWSEKSVEELDDEFESLIRKGVEGIEEEKVEEGEKVEEEVKVVEAVEAVEDEEIGGLSPEGIERVMQGLDPFGDKNVQLKSVHHDKYGLGAGGGGEEEEEEEEEEVQEKIARAEEKHLGGGRKLWGDAEDEEEGEKEGEVPVPVPVIASSPPPSSSSPSIPSSLLMKVLSPPHVPPPPPTVVSTFKSSPPRSASVVPSDVAVTPNGKVSKSTSSSGPSSVSPIKPCSPSGFDVVFDVEGGEDIVKGGEGEEGMVGMVSPEPTTGKWIREGIKEFGLGGSEGGEGEEREKAILGSGSKPPLSPFSRKPSRRVIKTQRKIEERVKGKGRAGTKRGLGKLGEVGKLEERKGRFRITPEKGI
ncbi:hypothetical protein TrCOL_g6744 [Triparma columacea]|uniref:Uncharacterized protein n=1 Tax=Triparma columacea TaxID=722753 RepID=A0A9W7G0F7_9STRA|nr:hypothetical protein TrCOL_g6744 [Triparma columacea]